jgi:hypothetical protein
MIFNATALSSHRPKVRIALYAIAKRIARLVHWAKPSGRSTPVLCLTGPRIGLTGWRLATDLSLRG